MSSPQDPNDGIPHAVAVALQKGGVGKTSISTTLAGIAAERGYSTVLVDLDPQGSSGRDLGVFDDERNDHGVALFEAVSLDRPLAVLKDVRPGLDVVTAGQVTENLARMSYGKRIPLTVVRSALRTIADDYDLMVIDTPPGERFLRESALTAARFALLPTRTDEASLDGVTRIAEDFIRVRDYNPSLELLGVALFGVNPSATAILRTVKEHLSESLGTVAPVFDTVIRYLEAPAVESRRAGMLVHEYARDVVDTNPRWFEQAAADRKRVATTAHKLADDYVGLAIEVLTEMRARLDADQDPAEGPAEGLSTVDVVGERAVAATAGTR